jgi:FkbM family methyltransferase
MKILPNGIAVIEGDTHISKWVEDHGCLDHDAYALPIILEHIKEGDWVVDAGAFIGDHTIAYIRAVGSSGKVIAFEPNPVAYECLVHNCPDATAFNVGLGDKREELKLAIDNNAGASHIGGDGQAIKVITLDSMPFKRLDFIKMDVEGFELMALNGARKTIETHKPTMWIEINAGALGRQGATPEPIFEMLKEIGYEITLYPEDGGPQYDILCIAK